MGEKIDIILEKYYKKEIDLIEVRKELFSVSILATVETGSLNEPHESDTDGCYLCKFGDGDGISDCEFCNGCKLESHQYYR